MLCIELDNCGKSFNRKWLFRNLSVTFTQGEKWAILGSNGSGKSTLGLMLAAQIWPTEGSLICQFNKASMPTELLFSKTALASPAMELPGEFNLEEIVAFHGKAKSFITDNALENIKNICGFDTRTAQKPLITFSSGMLQRVKLALAAFSDTPCIILDEPLSNLDKAGIAVYNEIIEKHCNNRLLVVASNREDEYGFCDNLLRINGDGSVSLDQ